MNVPGLESLIFLSYERDFIIYFEKAIMKLERSFNVLKAFILNKFIYFNNSYSFSSPSPQPFFQKNLIHFFFWSDYINYCASLLN
jgi:hypothetical protein